MDIETVDEYSEDALRPGTRDEHPALYVMAVNVLKKPGMHTAPLNSHLSRPLNDTESYDDRIRKRKAAPIQAPLAQYRGVPCRPRPRHGRARHTRFGCADARLIEMAQHQPAITGNEFPECSTRRVETGWDRTQTRHA